MNDSDTISKRKKYDESHGSPYDRGNADSYYRRMPDPHFWAHGSYHGTRTEECNMTLYQIEAYNAGYQTNEDDGNYKDYC
jgi:hypothetical protein